MSARSRFILGAAAVAVGIAAWVFLWAVPVSDVATERAAQLGLRWGAVALGVGGLVLATGGWRSGEGRAVGLGLAWLGTDALLSWRGGVSGAVATAVPVTVLAAALLVTGFRRSGRGDGRVRAPALLGYAAFLLAGSISISVLVLADDEDHLGWAVGTMAGGMVALAPALALAAGGRPASRRRARVATIVAVVLLVPAVLTGLTVGADPSSPMQGLRELRGWSFVFASPVVLATLVALSGALPRGRRGRTLASLILAGFPVVWTMLAAVGMVVSSMPMTSQGYPWLVGAAASIGAALVGVLAVVGGGFVQRSAVPAPPPAAAAGPDRRALAGAALALAGVAAWLVMALWVYPAIAAVLRHWHEQGGYLPYGLSATYDFAGIGWDARLSAILLAAGGLRLLARTRVRRRVVLAGVVAWFVTDVLLFGAATSPGVVRAVVGVVTAVVVAAVLVLLVLRVPLDAARAAQRSAWSLVYSGTSGAAGLLLLAEVHTWMYTDVPEWMVPAIAALTALLVVAAVLTAVTAAPRLDLLGYLGGTFFAVLAVCTVEALNFVRVADLVRTSLPRMAASGLVLGGLVLGCAVLGGYMPVRTAPRAWAAVIGATVVGGPVILAGSLLPAYLAAQVGGALLGTLRDLETPFVVDDGALPLTVASMVAGTIIAVVALLPQALSTPDGSADVPVPPPTPDPAPKRAPVAIPGVPEILEWPVAGPVR